MPASVGNVAGCAAVLAAVGALSFGLPAINHQIPPQRSISATAAYGVGLGVKVTPPSNTVVDARGTAPATNVVLFVRNGVEYKVQAFPYAGTVASLAAALRDAVAHSRGAQAIGTIVPVFTARGVAGLTARKRAQRSLRLAHASTAAVRRSFRPISWYASLGGKPAGPRNHVPKLEVSREFAEFPPYSWNFLMPSFWLTPPPDSVPHMA